MRECVGPLAYGFRLDTDAQGLRMVFEGWWLFGIPLPARTWAKVEAAQWQEGGEYCFSVDVAGIGIGPVIGYRGRLRLNPDEP